MLPYLVTIVVLIFTLSLIHILMVYGNLPSGAGLSSSASLEVLTGWALRDIFEFEVSDQEIALISQHAENTFNGVRCGVMDQFAVAMGRAHQAIYLNTENLSYRYVPVQLQNMQLIISCTNKERGLACLLYTSIILP